MFHSKPLGDPCDKHFHSRHVAQLNSRQFLVFRKFIAELFSLALAENIIASLDPLARPLGQFASHLDQAFSFSFAFLAALIERLHHAFLQFLSPHLLEHLLGIVGDLR